MKKLAIGVLGVIVGTFLLVQSSVAMTFGAAVDGNGSNNIIEGPGSIDFFIPLSSGASGTFDAVVGQSFDTCSGAGCDGGFLDMWVRFAGPPALNGQSIMTLSFIDFDTIGANDPAGFLESVEIFDGSLNSIAQFINVSQSLEGSGTGDETYETGAFLINSDPFWALLHFESFPQVFCAYKTCRNTIEELTISVAPVPLPAAIWLLGSALGGFGLLGWRRKRKAAA